MRLTVKQLAAVKSLTQQLWKTPYSIRVDSISKFQYSYAIGDDLIVDDLVNESEEAAARSAVQVRNIVMNEPLLMHRATNTQGNVVAASVSFAFPNKDASEKLDAYAYVNKLTQAFEKQHPQLNTYVSDLVALDATVSASRAPISTGCCSFIRRQRC